jgi:serine protease Do
MYKTYKITMVSVFMLTVVTIGLKTPAVLNTAYAADIQISKESIDILTKVNTAMSEVASAVKPAIVHISSTKTVKMQGVPSPFFNDPFFREFFGNPFGSRQQPSERRQSGLGSGVIVEKNGYILTNNHVVKGADEIKVMLSDKREFSGKIVGTDLKTDLAVIKIEADNLPSLNMGNSDAIRVGEMVIAVGNPFGLDQTVTSGIVSAKGRANVGIADYEDFIQTDAPINPGNSGGALVNVRGELVGINTAIVSSSGGNVGIGFAIPSNMAKVVMDSLVKKGKVVRGWLGVSIQAVTPDLGKQFGTKDEKGALVGDVLEEGPAAKAGVLAGDIIIEFDGREVVDQAGLRNAVAVLTPGRTVAMKVLRDGKELTINITVSEQPDQAQGATGDIDNQLRGVQVQDLTPELRKKMEISPRVMGVIVSEVDEESPAEGTLTSGDIIMQINRKSIRNVKDYEAVASMIDARQAVTLWVWRNGASFYATLSGE